MKSYTMKIFGGERRRKEGGPGAGYFQLENDKNRGNERNLAAIFKGKRRIHRILCKFAKIIACI